MIDISSARSACDAALNATPDGASFDSMLSVVHVARAALDELEALRKPSVASSLTWDVAAEADCYARGAVSDNVMRAAEVCYLAARLGRTHEDWIARSDDEQRSYVLTVRGMGMHPDAAPVDIDGAAEAGWLVRVGNAKDWQLMSPEAREHECDVARAVLAHVGRKVEPVTITDAVVEEAAIISWCAPTAEGTTTSRKGWALVDEDDKTTRRNEARAVLEYAVSIGLASSAKSLPFTQTAAMPHLAILAVCAACRLSEADTIERLAAHALRLESDAARWHELTASPRMTIPLAPAVDSRTEQLDRCRDRAARYVAERGVPESWDVTDRAQEIEAQAHAMLAAERSLNAV